jgi:hypothetical protein
MVRATAALQAADEMQKQVAADHRPALSPQDEELLDDIIGRLLDGRNARPGKPVSLTETEVRRWACS